MLNRDEFAIALRQGRGTALMHVMEHGLAGVEDLVLQACLENQAYDRQCEDFRAAWHYEMFKDAPAYARLSQSIVAALDADPDTFSAEHVCELVGLMAQNGDQAAGLALRKFVWGQEEISAEVTGSHAIVALDGLPAFVELARRLGRFLLENPGEYVDSLDYLTEDRAIAEVALAHLRPLAQGDVAIAAFVSKEELRAVESAAIPNTSDEQKTVNREKYRAEQMQEWPVERILDAASSAARTAKYAFVKFGRYASEHELNLVLERLETESGVEARRRLLWIFRKATLPKMSSLIWELANDSDSELRREATIALASLRDPSVGELGRQRFRDGDFSGADDDVIELFTLNYQPGDGALILGALEKMNPNDDDAHALAMAVRAVCAENDVAELAQLSVWIYRTNPCTICRERAIERLIDIQNVPQDIAIECRHDACKDTRDLVKDCVHAG
jgi:hypothetical protein